MPRITQIKSSSAKVALQLAEIFVAEGGSHCRYSRQLVCSVLRGKQSRDCIFGSTSSCKKKKKKNLSSSSPPSHYGDRRCAITAVTKNPSPGSLLISGLQHRTLLVSSTGDSSRSQSLPATRTAVVIRLTSTAAAY